MKKFIVVISLAAAVLTSGCGDTKTKTKKEWTLAPTATIQSIQAEQKNDLAAMRKLYSKKIDQLVSQCDKEKLAAKAVWKKGLISADACNARIAAIEAKYLDLHTKNTDWAQDLQADIQDRFEAKVELWKARK
jgi:hypothetical protein